MPDTFLMGLLDKNLRTLSSS